MSNANQTAVRVVEELVFGTTPATPLFEELRITGANLNSSPTTVTSNELVRDRQITDLIVVGFESGGDLPVEFSFLSLDTLIRGAMMSEWLMFPVRDNALLADTNITNVDASNVYTVITDPWVSGDKNKFKFGSFAVGHLVLASGFIAANNNGLKRVSAATATAVTMGTASTLEAVVPITARMKVVGIQGASGDMSASITGGNGLISAALNFATLGVVVGMWVEIGGTAVGDQFGTAALNGFARVSAVNAGRIDFDITPGAWAADAGTGKTIMIFVGDAIRNGTTARSYSVEMEYSDLAAVEYDLYTGMRVGTLSLAADTQAILTAGVSFMGKGFTNSTARFAGASTQAPPAYEIMNTSSNIAELREGGALVTANYPMKFDLQIDNTLRRQNAIGSKFSIGIGLGRVNVTGTFSTYYFNNSTRNKLLAGTATSLNFRATDPSLNQGYVFDIPRLKFTSGTPTNSGVDTDRTLDLPFQGIKHPTLGYTIQIQKFENWQI